MFIISLEFLSEKEKEKERKRKKKARRCYCKQRSPFKKIIKKKKRELT